MIEANNLTKRYGGHLALDDVSFLVEDGEIIGFLGPNGAGKSTCMNILTGYISATSGTVKIDGYDILEQPEEAKKHIGFLPELPPLYIDMTVREYLYFVYDLRRVTLPRDPHIKEICRLVQIDDMTGRLIKNLSKGYRQRVGIAAALVGNPDVLILDEPTVGLDPKQIIEVRRLIQRLGRHHTVILSSHILSEVQAVCERILMINRGSIVADDTPENLAHNFSDDYSLHVEVLGPHYEVKRLLEGIPDVKSATFTGNVGDAVAFSVEPRNQMDVRAEIFRQLARTDWPLVALRGEQMSLEEIFLKLTDSAVDDKLIAESLRNRKVARENADTVENREEKPTVAKKKSNAAKSYEKPAKQDAPPEENEDEVKRRLAGAIVDSNLTQKTVLIDDPDKPHSDEDKEEES